MGRRRDGELPQIKLHKASGNAFVNMNGTRIYLGQYGSVKAQDNYQQLIVEERIALAHKKLEELLKTSPAELVDHNDGVVFGSSEGLAGRYPQLPESWYYPSLLPHQIPDVSAVYIVINSKGECAYVGETQSMRRRYAEHKKWMGKRYKFSWIEVSQSERLFVQSHFIAALRPTRNRLPGTRNAEEDCELAVIPPVRLRVKARNRPLSVSKQKADGIVSC